MGAIERTAKDGARGRLGWSGVCAVLAWALLRPDLYAVEARAGQPPFTPRIVSVTADPKTPLTRLYTLVEPFADPDDRDMPTATEWQVEDLPAGAAPDPSSRRVYRTAAAAPPGAPHDLLLVPTGVLVRDARYAVRVRYRDAQGNWSPWSPPAPLRMPPGPARRAPAPRPSPIAAAAGAGTVVPLGALGADDLDAAHRVAGALPYGLTILCIRDVAPGATVAVTYTLPAPPPEGARWVHHHPGSGLEDRTAAAYMNLATVSEPLTDGGPGDADGVDNGTIVAIVGLLLPRPPA